MLPKAAFGRFEPYRRHLQLIPLAFIRRRHPRSCGSTGPRRMDYLTEIETTEQGGNRGEIPWLPEYRVF